MRLSSEVANRQGPLEISISSRGKLVQAELQMQWKIEGEVLLSKGTLSFKLPFKDAALFQISGRDLIDSEVKIHLESFSFEDGKSTFGSWQHLPLEEKILYKGDRKTALFNFEKDRYPGAPVMSAGAILFCLLRTGAISSRGNYLGAEKIYETKFLIEEKDHQQKTIQISFSRSGSAEEPKNIACLFLNTKTQDLLGGELILPIFGKLGFNSSVR